MEPMIFSQTASFIENGGIDFIIKIFILLGFFIYFIYSLVVMVQIKRMFETISTGAEIQIFAISIIHTAVSLIALLWAFMVL